MKFSLLVLGTKNRCLNFKHRFISLFQNGFVVARFSSGNVFGPSQYNEVMELGSKLYVMSQA